MAEKSSFGEYFYHHQPFRSESNTAQPPSAPFNLSWDSLACEGIRESQFFRLKKQAVCMSYLKL